LSVVETIAKVEHFIVSTIASVIPESVRLTVRGYWEAFKNRGKKELGEHEQEKVDMVGWGVEEAQERYEEKASLATQLALAYAIHKSFIFVRLPLTAAVTPRVVKTLRSWGWNIGKPKPKV
jgi:meiotically up-regulated gene 157 (Mug157) protein